MFVSVLQRINLQMGEAWPLILLMIIWTTMLASGILLSWYLTRRQERKNWSQLLPEQARLKLLEYQTRVMRLEKDNGRLIMRNENLAGIIRAASMEASHLLVNLQGVQPNEKK